MINRIAGEVGTSEALTRDARRILARLDCADEALANRLSRLIRVLDEESGRSAAGAVSPTCPGGAERGRTKVEDPGR